MEWVETTGKTIDEAKGSALDQLGVDEQDAEFEVLEEPRAGLFGRTRGEARVRARVRPTQPRPKVERRDRKPRSGRAGDKGKADGSPAKGGGRASAPADPSGTRASKADESDVVGSDPETSSAPTSDAQASDAQASEVDRGAVAPAAGDRPSRSRQGGGRGGSRGPNGNRADREDDEERNDMSETELAEQGEVVRAFLLDLLDAFGLDGEVTATPAEEGAVELDVTGGDLGLLIGPKGQTLQAIQELSRSALQRQKPGETHARIRVDVSGYRQRRREALERFVQGIAAEVKASGVRKALEPMSPPDRKVVHDTVNELEGVTTVSEGEDARRRVVILPG